MNPFRRHHGDARPRIGLALFVLFQLLVAVGLPAGDAVLEASSVDTPLHVEAPTDEACGNPHDHLFCQLCRSLTFSGFPGSVLASDALFGTALARVPASATAQRLPGVHLAGPWSARGPPQG